MARRPDKEGKPPRPNNGEPEKGALLLLAALLAIGGCAARQETAPPQADPNLRLVLTTQPAAPRELDPTRFTMTLKDKYGKPITKAAVTLNLMMPDMDMGSNTVTLTPQAAGTYTGTGRFTMLGAWRVRATVSAPSDHAVQDFPVTVR